jgi:hydrogenase nickel incorporation protein HypA/HybF
MHELAITQSIVDAVVEHVGEEKVLVVRLRIGPLSGVVPDALRFCFDLAAEGTCLSGARLEIEEPVAVAHCRDCDADFELPDHILLCPCGSADVAVLSGRELKISSVEVA